MPGPYGVVSTGFNAKSLEEIRADLNARVRTELGASIDVSDNTALGQLLGIVADRIADLYQLGQATYASAFPDTAAGAGLDRNAALTGATRAPASVTLVNVRLSGTVGTVIPSGSIVSVPGVTSARFQTLAPATIGGAGFVNVTVYATTTGPIYALANTVTQIDTPVTGWVSVNNTADQVYLGTDAESDGALRLRRVASIRAQGGAAFEAVRARVLAVSGVTDCYVFANESDATVDTIPPHAFEVVVRGGSDAAIALAIYQSKPTAIATSGTTTTTLPDSQGGTQTIKFTRPTVLDVYVTISLTVNAAAPSSLTDIATSVALAVVAYGDLYYRTGSQVVAQALVPAVFSAIAGVVDVPNVFIGTAPTPVTSTTITPTKRQICDLDTSRVVVNTTRV